MSGVEDLMKRIKLLPEESVREVTDFIEFLEAKRAKRAKRAERTAEEEAKDEGKDPIAAVIGICEGPSDLAEKHTTYIYG
jgi:hypothetical protein